MGDGETGWCRGDLRAGLSHLAGTTFMEELQVHWGILFQPLQPLGGQILSKGRKSACDRSQRPLLEGAT